MGVVSGREEARESKAGTHYKFIFCTIPVHFLVSRHVVAQLLFFSSVSSCVFPSQVGQSFPFTSLEDLTPCLLSLTPTYFPLCSCLSVCSPDKMNFLLSLPSAGWSPVQLRTWSFGRRSRFWRIPTGERRGVRSGSTCLMEGGGCGGRSRTSAGRKVGVITLAGRLCQGAQDGRSSPTCFRHMHAHMHTHHVYMCTHVCTHTYMCTQTHVCPITNQMYFLITVLKN